MRVLVGCEFSQVVTKAFRARGHEAFSCDVLPTEGNSDWHIQGDLLEVIGDGWDIGIFHPPCTYLSVSGMHWTTRGLRDPQLTEDALHFVQSLMDADIPRIALENPISIISSHIRKPDQIIQPWMFGHDASKKTCLWLKNLPPLTSDLYFTIAPDGWERVMSAADMSECPDCGEPYCDRHEKHYAECDCIGITEDDVTVKELSGVSFGTRLSPPPKMRWGNQTKCGQNKLAPSPNRWKERSRTYEGVAKAMADQWSI